MEIDELILLLLKENILTGIFPHFLERMVVIVKQLSHLKVQASK